MTCITLPPAPPAYVAPQPPPIWAPVTPYVTPPVTPIPAPAPGPAPGYPAVAVDMANSYVLGDLGCLDNAYLMPQIAMQNNKSVGNFANLVLIAQNLSGTAAGSITIGVTVNNARCIVDLPRQTVPVPAGSFVQVNFLLYVSSADDLGSYIVTIDTGGGATTDFNLSFTGATSCV